jgi:HD-GYP domain-containing protein (c-di-GMP phosphodiesterase class II)
MPIDPDLAEQERIAAAAEGRRAGVARRERAVEGLLGLGWIAAVAAIWLAAGIPDAQVHVAPALACMVCLAVAVHIPFAVGDGYTVPTQLAFVPLLFTLPPALVPPAVVAALILARLPGVVAGSWPPSRLLLIPADGWFSVGPAAVLAVAGPRALDDPQVLVVVAALAAQVVVEVAAWALRERLLGGAGMREQLAELWIHGVDLALTPVALVVALAVDQRPWAPLAILPLLGVLATFSRERQARLTGLTELNQAYRGTALVLGDVLEADDGYTGAHSRGVVALALELGDALELDVVQRRNLEFGALLHDVGKVAIPKAIINKPGKLDPAEWAIVKTHTIEGQRMLDRVGGFMRDVGMIVRSHHEWWDGSGYPDGLSGEAIPLESRIVACCDAWNAMTTTRSYREAMSPMAATAELRRNAGVQFDPRVVEALLALVPDESVQAVDGGIGRSRGQAA